MQHKNCIEGYKAVYPRKKLNRGAGVQMKKIIFGVDVGGTSVKLGMFGIEGNLLKKWEIPTRKEEKGKYIISDIANSISDTCIQQQIDKAEIGGVGIGVPGPVTKDGVVIKCVNLGWDVVNIKDDLTSLLQVPVFAGNDANVAALGEMWKGGGEGYQNIIMVTLGTGVGGGVIIDGKILSGSTGSAGEIGHMHVEDRESRVCNCGNTGCLEQFASATGITFIAKRLLSETEKDSILRDSDVSAKSVFDGVKSGDSLAIEVAEQFGKYLGKALAVAATITNPEIFVIGGGVSKAGDVLLSYIDKYYNLYAFAGCRNAKFKLATLGNDAGIYGAAKLVIS